MTKKDFKQKCDFHQYGKGQSKKNAIFFDWKEGEVNGKRFQGYKFMVSARGVLKSTLFNIFYNWVTQITCDPPYFVNYRFADTDEKRFKVPISM